MPGSHTMSSVRTTRSRSPLPRHGRHAVRLRDDRQPCPRDPSRYRNRQVTIAGRVVDSVSLGGRGAYRVEDRTGSLWVISDVGVPRTGARVKVKGRILDAFNVGVFGGRVNLPGGLASGLVMQETSHKAN